MSGSLNKVILVGNLGRDPEIRSMQNGDKVANLNIATSENWKDRDGNRQTKTEWHRVVIFGKIAEVCERYLKKGSKVLIEGKLVTRKWVDQNNNDKYTTEVVVSGFNGGMTMLDSRGGDGQSNSGGGGYGGGQSNNNQSNNNQSNNGGGYGGGQSNNNQSNNNQSNNSGNSSPDYSADLDDDIPF